MTARALAFSAWRERAGALAPGVLIALTIAAASRFISEHYGAPAMLFALLIGMAFHFLTEEGKCAEGVEFTSKTLLKWGVALLGARVTFDQIASLGIGPLLMAPALIIGTIGAGVLIARAFGRPWTFGLLTGGAVAICGASAALALSSVLPKTEEMRRDTLFTVVAVTSLSTVAMVLYPVLFASFGLDDMQIGVLIGATIHDVAQVVGAGYAVSEDAGNVATYVKLLRVACLPVAVLAYALIMRRAARAGGGGLEEAAAPFPWFAVAFALILVANSVGAVPAPLRSAMDWSSGWLLIAAISALGMKTSLKAMASLGARHVWVVVAETVALCAAAVGALLLMSH
ncbi:MAG: putative sulfate exporter family transporter [Pseudomonadota bacterium]